MPTKKLTKIITQTRLFDSTSPLELEKLINEFLSHSNIKYIDTKFAIDPGYKDETLTESPSFVAMVIYKETKLKN